MTKSVIALSNSLRIRHPAWARLRRYLPDYRDPGPLARPVSALMEDVNAYLRGRATLYSEYGKQGLARLAIAGAGLASFILEYPRILSLGQRGRLHEVAKLKFRRGVEVDFRAYSHGGETRSDLPSHLLTRSVAKRLSVKTAVDDVFATLNMPRPFEAKAARDEKLKGLMESLVSKYWLGEGKDLVLRNSSLDSARLLAVALTPYVRDLHSKALAGVKKLNEVKGVINALINGELHRLIELSQLMGIDHEKARESLDKALGSRAKELMSRHMRDRRVRDLAREDIRNIIDALRGLKSGGVALSTKPLSL